MGDWSGRTSQYFSKPFSLQQVEALEKMKSMKHTHTHETPEPAPGECCSEERSKDRKSALKVGDVLVLRILLRLTTRTVGQALEIGRILPLLKAFLKHGEFRSALQRLGLQRSTVSRLISSASVFSRMPNVRKHAHSESMLFELLPLGAERLDELERTGCLGGLRLVEMPRMTVQQLRRIVSAIRGECGPP